MRSLQLLGLRGLLVLCAAACGTHRRGPPVRQVVVYTSVDQVYAEPVLQTFAEQSGIDVLPVFDVEAAKTTGLVNRLIAEQQNPQADVFWNGEFAQTLRLKREGVLAPYQSPAASDLPSHYVDADGEWTGISGRARVLIYNTTRIDRADVPTTLRGVFAGDIPGEQIGLAYPLFGTTATHAAALYAAWGASDARAFFAQVQASGVRVVDGNSVVRDMVVAGELAMGLTDTDDACAAIQRGASVDVLFLDQREDEMGTLIIPGSVALVRGAPHPEAARAFIDYLVSRDTEAVLIESGWVHMPLRDSMPQPACFTTGDVRGMAVGFAEIEAQLARAQEELGALFVR